MEKFVVVAGIWMMCAFCAVLFIRGASTPALRRVRVGDGKTGDEDTAQ